MTNRKLITAAFLIGFIIIYSVVWYFVSQNMNGFLTKRMEITQEKIKLSGFPFNINFKIEDASIKSVSYNLLSKKLFVNLKKEALDSLVDHKIEDVFKDIEYIKLSSKLDSYFTLMRIIQNKGTKFEQIDAFNLFSNIGISLKANMNNQGLNLLVPVAGTWKLSIPNKRIYKNFEDILSDLPQHMTLEGDYEENMIVNEDVVPVMQKFAKLSYPAKYKFNGKLSLSGHVDARNMDQTKFIELMRKLNLDLTLAADSNISNSQTKIEMNAATDAQSVNIEYSSAQKDGALQNYYTIFKGEDIAEIIETILYNYNVQLNDNSKLKFKLFGDLIFKKMQTAVENNPNYWHEFDNYKSNLKISMLVPYKEGFGSMKYLMDIADNKISSCLKIEGSMKGSGIPDSTKGVLLINNKSQNISEIIEVLRLLYFASSRIVTSDYFKLVLKNFDNDVKTIDDILLSLSDDPKSTSDKILYSYDINKEEMMNSKFSKTGKTLLDVLVGFAPLFLIAEK